VPLAHLHDGQRRQGQRRDRQADFPAAGQQETGSAGGQGQESEKEERPQPDIHKNRRKHGPFPQQQARGTPHHAGALLNLLAPRSHRLGPERVLAGQMGQVHAAMAERRTTLDQLRQPPPREAPPSETGPLDNSQPQPSDE